MMQHHLNHMRQAAIAAGEGVQYVRQGTVTGYNPNSYTAKVMLLPEGIETGWMPIGALAVGDGFGIQAAPSLGDLVNVEFPDGDLGAGVVALRCFADDARPVALQSGQFIIKHQDGSFIKFVGGGVVQVSASAEIDVTAPVAKVTASTSAEINSPQTTVNGAFTVNGLTTLNGGITQTAPGGGGSTAANLIGPVTVTNDVTAGGKSLEHHTHPNGTPNTGQPN